MDEMWPTEKGRAWTSAERTLHGCHGMEAIAWIIAAAVIAGVIGYTMKRKRRAPILFCGARIHPA